jgi:hypothetical protein
MQFERRKPAPSLAVAFQLGFADLECVGCNVLKQVNIAGCVAPFAVTLFYRVFAVSQERSPLISLLARLLERNKSGCPQRRRDTARTGKRKSYQWL